MTADLQPSENVSYGFKMRRARIEHISCAYHSIATDERTSRIGRFVPLTDSRTALVVAYLNSPEAIGNLSGIVAGSVRHRLKARNYPGPAPVPR
jgi:hypothetical protein